MNKWLVLKERIGKQLEILKEDVQKNKAIYNSRDSLKEFLDSQKAGKPNLKILETLPNDVLDKDGVIKLRNIIWKKSFQEIQSVYNKILEILYAKYNNIVANGTKIKNYIDITDEVITLYSKAYSIITNEGITEACNQELMNAIIDVITELDMDDMLVKQMIQELKQKNEELLKNTDKQSDVNVDNNKIELTNNNNEDSSKGVSTLESTKDDIILKGTNIIRNVKDIIDYFKEVLEHYSELNIDDEKYANIYARIEYLKQAIYDYNESLEIYFNSSKTDDEAVNYFYDELNHGYHKLLSEKEKIEIKQMLDDNLNEFYVPTQKLKNLIIFIPIDDSDVSNMEYSLSNDENIEPSHYNSIKLGLQRLLLGYEDALVTHNSKSKKYSEEFIKKYHVKSIKTSKCRIMYSRYSTTLKQRYPEFTENPNVIFVFNAGYGNLDGIPKRYLYENGLDECSEYSAQIDEIRSLLNIDWSKIPLDEAEQYDKEIRALFDLQKRKMDHFLNTCVMKQNANDKNKRVK